ncbi:type III secretion system inner membrane ring subunit SctD [Chlamydiifrater volucris]|uniref:type III secretion system inner membrane ring subunit SctD n=1 Tax=Chlamydiifrater volucris TaxID=2681470 RepID=UPI001BCDA75F|nr:type III secretion system inner membrane ring subunit SctD [Chlamydiifrater volucris]
MAVRLVVSKGPLSGMVLSLEEGDNWSIGRDAKQSDIAIEDSGLAPCQALIYKEGDVYYVKNTDSSKEVLVNGVAVADTSPLKDSDLIVLGSNTYSFFIEKEEDFNEAFFFEFGETENVSALPSKGAGSKKEKESSERKGSSKGKKKDEKASSGPQGFTEKDQALSEAFLASAKNAGSPEEMVEIPDSSEKLNAEGVGDAPKKETPSAENTKIESADSNDEAPQKAEGKEAQKDGAEGMKNVEQPSSPSGQSKEDSPPNKEEAESSKRKDEVKANKSSPQQGPEKEADVSAEKVEIDKGKGTLNPEVKQENGVESSPSKEVSGENNPPKEEAPVAEAGGEGMASAGNDGQEENPVGQVENNTGASAEQKTDKPETTDNKPKVLAPFDVEDLFDFDKGIFPAELDNSGKDVTVDLSRPSRFLLKVLAGANIGAEFHLDAGKEYIIGSNADICDVVFDDTSVSHQHAKLIVSSEGAISIEDLGSKNGVVVEGKKIESNSSVSANMVVALGTTLFLLIDQQAPAETIVASFSPENYGLFGRQDPEVDPLEEERLEEEAAKKATLPTGTFILTLFIGGLAILFGIGTASLFHSKEVIPIENIDFQSDLEGVTKLFPGVRYTFNKNNGQLFLVGHVKNGIEKSELMYKIDALFFVKSVDDNVIDDEAVWQEMNILLSKRPEFKGISMSSPEPGRFVLNGYVKTEEQAACLTDYLNLHFQYLSLLDNSVIVENIMLKSIEGRLLQNGFGNIQVSFINGELILTGYVNNSENERFRSVIQELGELSGVRVVKNFAVLLPAEEGLIDLSHRYPNRYRVTGYSKYGDVSINVVVNGKILTRGDVIDGMTVTSIQPNSIFLERDGLKYKIDYNK